MPCTVSPSCSQVVTVTISSRLGLVTMGACLAMLAMTRFLVGMALSPTTGRHYCSVIAPHSTETQPHPAPNHPPRTPCFPQPFNSTRRSCWVVLTAAGDEGADSIYADPGDDAFLGYV